MPTIYIEPDQKEVVAESSETILSASLRAGIPHVHACGGNARCSTCRVSIENGLEYCAPRNELEKVLAERLGFSSEVRLACQTTVSGNVKVRRLIADEDDVEVTKALAEVTGPISIGEEKNLAILFADIRNFTSISEKLPPYDIIYILNRYFYYMWKVISDHQGYIDNYMGDGLMALFGIDDLPDATFRAVSAGLKMIEEVKRASSLFTEFYGITFEIGIGIHYGQVIVGTIGADKPRTTALGDAVNVASRIERANKEYGTRLLISESAFKHVGTRTTIGRRIEHVIFKGKTGHHMLYEVTGLNVTAP